MDMATWIGPQADSDAAATRRHRFHQSWYRAYVLGVAPGTGPRPTDATTYGNMLTRADGAAGKNFLTSQIAAYAEERMARGGTVEPFRCRHNMLSSQPMCFNLFAPLRTRPALAAALVRSVVGEDVTVDADQVEIEDSPGLLGDATGLDASIRYRTSDGRGGILGIETKLTEQFSPTVYTLESREAYVWYSTQAEAPFDTDNLDALTDARWNQLWRNQMLTEAIRENEQRELAHQLVVFPEGVDKTSTLVTEYAVLLARPEAVQARTLGDVITVFEGAAETEDLGWLQALRRRYVDIELSGALFTAWQRQQPPFGATTS